MVNIIYFTLASLFILIKITFAMDQADHNNILETNTKHEPGIIYKWKDIEKFSPQQVAAALIQIQINYSQKIDSIKLQEWAQGEERLSGFIFDAFHDFENKITFFKLLIANNQELCLPFFMDTLTAMSKFENSQGSFLLYCVLREFESFFGIYLREIEEEEYNKIKVTFEKFSQDRQTQLDLFINFPDIFSDTGGLVEADEALILLFEELPDLSTYNNIVDALKIFHICELNPNASTGDYDDHLEDWLCIDLINYAVKHNGEMQVLKNSINAGYYNGPKVIELLEDTKDKNIVFCSLLGVSNNPRRIFDGDYSVYSPREELLLEERNLSVDSSCSDTDGKYGRHWIKAKNNRSSSQKEKPTDYKGRFKRTSLGKPSFKKAKAHDNLEELMKLIQKLENPESIEIGMRINLYPEATKLLQNPENVLIDMRFIKKRPADIDD